MSSLEKIDQQLSLLNLSRKEIPKDGSCLVSTIIIIEKNKNFIIYFDY